MSLELVPEVEGSFVDACLTALGRAGALTVQLRRSDVEPPDLWLAYCQRKLLPQAPATSEVAAGMSPEDAVYRLLERVLDGSTCQHCGRTIGVVEVEDLPEDELITTLCWYSYRSSSKSIVAGCRVLAEVAT